METITIKINKLTKAGRAFLEMVEVFFKGKNGIEVMETKKDKNIPNAETLRSMEKTSKGIGLTNTKWVLRLNFLDNLKKTQNVAGKETLKFHYSR